MCLSQNLHKLESCISRTLNKILNRILEVFVIEFLDDFLRGGNQKHWIKGETMQWPKEQVETMIYKTLHWKLKIEQHEPHYKRSNFGAPGQ